jgi:hypothetical protein
LFETLAAVPPPLVRVQPVPVVPNPVTAAVVTATGAAEDQLKLLMVWVEVTLPVPPVKPRYALLAPTRVARSMLGVTNVYCWLVTVSCRTTVTVWATGSYESSTLIGWLVSSATGEVSVRVGMVPPVAMLSPEPPTPSSL